MYFYRAPVLVLYGPEPLSWQFGLDTERIIVPFSSTGVKHMAYITHVVNVQVYCVCYGLSNSYAIVLRHNRCFN